MRKSLLKICILLFIVILLITSCSIENENTTSNIESSRYEKEDNESKDPYANIPDVYYNGLNFNILTFVNEFCADGYSHFGYGEELEENIVNTAIEKRNAAVEEKLGINIIETAIDDSDRMCGTAYQTFINIVQSGINDYYIVCPSVYTSAILAQEGYFVDLMSLENLHKLKATWWDQFFVNQMSLNDKLYFVTGDMCTYSRTSLSVIYFNKNLFEDYGLENPYELVKNRKWTINKMYEMSKTISTDIDNNGLIDYKDKFGIGGQVDTVLFWLYAFNGTIASKDSDDNPYLTINSKYNQDRIEKILTIMHDNNCYINANDYWSNTDEYVISPSEIIRNSFIEGNCLFFISDIKNINSFQNMDQDFGILPFPLYDENQQDYAHILGCWSSNTLTIPKYIGEDKTEIASIVMEALGAETKEIVTPAFYEIMLKLQRTRDLESIDMIDIIFNSIICDLGTVYNWGDINEMLFSLAMNPNDNFVSKWDSISTIAQSELDQTKEKFNEIN